MDVDGIVLASVVNSPIYVVQMQLLDIAKIFCKYGIITKLESHKVVEKVRNILSSRCTVRCVGLQNVSCEMHCGYSCNWSCEMQSKLQSCRVGRWSD